MKKNERSACKNTTPGEGDIERIERIEGIKGIRGIEGIKGKWEYRAV